MSTRGVVPTCVCPNLLHLLVYSLKSDFHKLLYHSVVVFMQKNDFHLIARVLQIYVILCSMLASPKRNQPYSFSQFSHNEKLFQVVCSGPFRGAF